MRILGLTRFRGLDAQTVKGSLPPMLTILRIGRMVAASLAIFFSLGACTSREPVRVTSCRWFYRARSGAEFHLSVKLQNVSERTVVDTVISLFPMPGTYGASTTYDVRKTIRPGETVFFGTDDAGVRRVRTRSVCGLVIVTFSDGSVWRTPPKSYFL